MDTLRVLVVDDEAGMRHSITRALSTFRVPLPEMDGDVRFEVESVESGEEALARCNDTPPDILLLDYKMGGMTGLEVLETLREKSCETLAIMVTAFASIETAVRATKSGAFDFMTKPFTPDELRETIRKAAAHRFAQRQARELAADKRRVRFEFIRVLGHELKAPLGAIESYLNVMADGAAGPMPQAYEKMIGRCRIRCSGMRKLIADLLDMTRIEAGEKKRELRTIDLRTIAETAIENQAMNAEKRGITIGLDAPDAAPFIGDGGELEIVLNNLVSNAVKYNRDGGRVDVRLVCDEKQVAIAVRDTGIGLTAEDAGKLFSDFVRIKNTDTLNISGSGLGLSIVKKIAQLYAGSATVRSSPEGGSTFKVVLKRQQAEGMRDGCGDDKAVASRG